MAFDKNDPADKKILADAIEAALAEARENFEAETAGLKKKNRELLSKTKDVPSADEIARLEKENDDYITKIRDLEKQIKITSKERDELKTNYESESAATKRMIIDNSLTESLLKANVRKELMPAVKALLLGKVSVKIDGDNRVAVVGDKSLGDYVSEWSQGDEGKVFVAAPVNNGGAAQGGKASPGSSKTVTRSVFDTMSQIERSDFALKGGKIEG